MHATRVVAAPATQAAPRAACTIRVAVWSAYPLVADAVRDCLRRAPAGFDAERLLDVDVDASRYDVGLVLHGDVETAAPARLVRDGVPVLQLADDVRVDHPGVHVLPCGSAMPAIVRVIERIALPGGEPSHSILSLRELEVATLYAQGQPIVAIAAELDIGLESVRTYLRRARAKLRDDGFDASSQARLAELHASGRLLQRAPRQPVTTP